ncbi:hypothetical protein [Mammaliicoccus sciuri]|uniref:hypothetical protein n=1 Tax=Mammaliicoccus sciuri TaxID=1296 RepID=UPI00374E2AE3
MNHEHNDVLDELIGISGMSERERQSFEKDFISSIRINQLNREEQEESGEAEE